LEARFVLLVIPSVLVARKLERLARDGGVRVRRDGHAVAGRKILASRANLIPAVVPLAF
jgi:hypothetical protein